MKWWNLIRPFIPALMTALVAFGAGWSADRYVMNHEVTAAEQETVRLKQEMTAAVQKAKDDEYAKNVEAQNAWAANLDALKRSWRTGWMPVVPAEGGGPGTSLPPDPGPDGACRDTVLAARKLAQDCSKTTLELNALQAIIESQSGY